MDLRDRGDGLADGETIARALRWAWPFVWLLGLGAIIGLERDANRTLVGSAMTIAGVCVAAYGAVLATDYRGVREVLSEQEGASWRGRVAGLKSYSMFHGVMGIVVGVGWTAAGIAVAF